MKISTYLNNHCITSQNFAKMAGVSVGAVRKWRCGTRLPRIKMVAKIFKLTKGKVRPNDWYK